MISILQQIDSPLVRGGSLNGDGKGAGARPRGSEFIFQKACQVSPKNQVLCFTGYCHCLYFASSVSNNALRGSHAGMKLPRLKSSRHSRGTVNWWPSYSYSCWYLAGEQMTCFN